MRIKLDEKHYLVSDSQCYWVVGELEKLANESLYGECDDVTICTDYCSKCYLDRAIAFVKGVQNE